MQASPWSVQITSGDNPQGYSGGAASLKATAAVGAISLNVFKPFFQPADLKNRQNMAQCHRISKAKSDGMEPIAHSSHSEVIQL